MPTLLLDNRTIYYVDCGSDHSPVTLLAIHGAGGAHSIWDAALFELPGVRVIAIDLPGHGESQPPGRRTIEHYADVIERFALSLGLENLVLVGHSMGSAIALAVAQRAVIQVSGLILIGASARMPVGEAMFSGALSDLGGIGDFLANKTMVEAPEAHRQLVNRQLLSTGGTTTSGDFLACNRFDLRRQLASISTPSLIIAGRLDIMVPLRFSESLSGSLPHSRVFVLENTGHYAMLERPNDVRNLTLDFLKTLKVKWIG